MTLVVLSNSALEEPASAAGSWQIAQGRTVAWYGPRPGPTPPPLIAGAGGA
jgi:hypothetical protein